MSSNMQRIIRRMKQTLNVYRFVKLVERVSNDAAAKEQSEEILWVGRSYHAPIATPLKYRFAEKYHYTLQQVGDICEDAIEYKYLGVSTRKAPKNVVDVLEVTTKGRRLLDTIPGLPFLPYGLIRAWWKKDKLAIQIFITAGSIIITYALTDTTFSLIRAIISRV
jgi:hypothetical protein